MYGTLCCHVLKFCCCVAADIVVGATAGLTARRLPRQGPFCRAAILSVLFVAAPHANARCEQTTPRLLASIGVVASKSLYGSDAASKANQDPDLTLACVTSLHCSATSLSWQLLSRMAMPGCVNVCQQPCSMPHFARGSR